MTTDMPGSKADKATRRRRLDVLIVDDDPLIGVLLQGGMDAKRFAVSVAHSGREAIAMCDSSCFDLVVLDYQMPGKSGLEVAGVLREKQIPFVMVSAFAENRIEQRAARQGALGYLIKPVSPKQVELAVDTALARATEINNLARAAEVSGIVGVAVGLVMGVAGRSRMDALESLTRFCRPRNQSLKLVSMEVTNLYEMRLSSGGEAAAREALIEYLNSEQRAEDD